MEKILIFIIFLGPLVFFHELGHFLFARLFGVRVEVFSIGFGPKLFSIKKGDTRYALSLIPLGGYVKMFGDDPLSEDKLSPEEEAVAYTKKGKWARFWIVFGGPFANFIMAFMIYFLLVSFGEKLPQTKFGSIPKESPLYTIGVRTGDILTKVNEQEIISFDDFNLIDSDISSITILRGDKNTNLGLSMKGLDFVKEFGKVSRPLRSPIVVNAKGENFLLRDTEGKLLSFEEILESNMTSLQLEKIRESVDVEFQIQNYQVSKTIDSELKLSGSWEESLRNAGYFPRELYVKNIQMNSAASDANLKAGDIIVAVNGKTIFHFDQLQSATQEVKNTPNKQMTLTILNHLGTKDIIVKPQERNLDGHVNYVIGVESGISFYSYMVEHKSHGFADAIKKSYMRTKVGFVKTLLGFKKLIVGEVSLKQVGGPIAIGQVASDSFNISLSMFFRLMAIISINLGIINLFPIPVLDGGHIVFILLELVNGGPLSRKKLMYAQQAGMSLLFLLIFVALYNDISRFF